MFLALMIGLNSCDKKTEDISTITYFVNIELNGDALVFHEKGTPWVDPGFSATEGDDDVTANVVVTTPSMNELGYYEITYSATNSDGYAGHVTRNVVVYDGNLSTTDISGEYTSDVVRNSSESYAGNPVVISKTPVDGVYEISDWIGGFYNIGRGYGAGYAFHGYFQMKSDTEFDIISSTNPWNAPLDSVENMVYNPTDNTITYTAKWLGKYNYDISLY